MKVKCKYCGIEKRVPPGRIKSSETYYCGSAECRKEHMKEIGKKENGNRDYSQQKKLKRFAKINGKLRRKRICQQQ